MERSIAINYVHEATARSNAAITYIYISYKDANTHSEMGLARNLIRQLAEQRVSLPADVVAFRDRYADKKSNPTAEDLLSLIRRLCLLFRKTFIFIDALVLEHLRIQAFPRHDSYLS